MRGARVVLFEEHACGLSGGQTALRVHDPPASGLWQGDPCAARADDPPSRPAPALNKTNACHPIFIWRDTSARRLDNGQYCHHDMTGSRSCGGINEVYRKSHFHLAEI